MIANTKPPPFRVGAAGGKGRSALPGPAVAGRPGA